MMRVRVRFFSWLQDAVGLEECRLTLGPGARGSDLQTTLTARYPQLERCWTVTRLAVNHDYRPWDHGLHDGDEVGLIPPVSGG